MVTLAFRSSNASGFLVMRRPCCMDRVWSATGTPSFSSIVRRRPISVQLSSTSSRSVPSLHACVPTEEERRGARQRWRREGFKERHDGTRLSGACDHRGCDMVRGRGRDVKRRAWFARGEEAPCFPRLATHGAALALTLQQDVWSEICPKTLCFR